MELMVRPWRDDEEDEFVDLATDPRVTAQVGDGSPWSRERARARSLRARAVVDAGRGVWWRVGDLDDGLVGLLVAELDEGDHAVEIGYWIVPERWGRGAATRLVAIAVARLAVAFPGTDLRAETHVGNLASAAVLQRNGFVEGEQGVGRHGTPVRRFSRPGHLPS
jgi:[ribosomal protein S5]-alanine N-acetyltransferase